jgi:hypothetical protein
MRELVVVFLGGTAASGGSSEKWPSQVGGAEPRLIRYGSRMVVRMERTVSVWILYLLAVCGRMDLTVVLWISLPPYPSLLRRVPSRLAYPPPSPKEPSDIMPLGPWELRFHGGPVTGRADEPQTSQTVTIWDDRHLFPTR